MVGQTTLLLSSTTAKDADYISMVLRVKRRQETHTTSTVGETKIYCCATPQQQGGGKSRKGRDGKTKKRVGGGEEKKEQGAIRRWILFLSLAGWKKATSDKVMVTQ